MFCPAGFIQPEQPQVNCGDTGEGDGVAAKSRFA